MSYKILIVDDEEANLRALDRLLSYDYQPLTAGSGAEALEILAQHDCAMIISDQRMPEMSGLDFLKQAAEVRPKTIRILLTGYTDIDTLVEAINCGIVYKYVTKPWNNDELLQLIKRGFEHFESIKTLHSSKGDLARLERKINAARSAVMHLWCENIRLRSPELSAHAKRIERYAGAIADLMSLSPEQIALVSTAGLLFSTVYASSTISDVVVGKPVEDEDLGLRTVELESELAAFFELRCFDDFEQIEDVIRFANENFDGTGFPSRLAAERIPVASRILAVARAYDLITSAPIEEFGLSHEAAIQYLKNGPIRNTLDQSIVDVLGRLGFVSQIPDELLRSRQVQFVKTQELTWA
jgi:response regulator RpfG family c-di-GMP phosphodiesterase